jgi:hypothetical protein
MAATSNPFKASIGDLMKGFWLFVLAGIACCSAVFVNTSWGQGTDPATVPQGVPSAPVAAMTPFPRGEHCDGIIPCIDCCFAVYCKGEICDIIGLQNCVKECPHGKCSEQAQRQRLAETGCPLPQRACCNGSCVCNSWCNCQTFGGCRSCCGQWGGCAMPAGNGLRRFGFRCR